MKLRSLKSGPVFESTTETVERHCPCCTTTFCSTHSLD